MNKVLLIDGRYVKPKIGETLKPSYLNEQGFNYQMILGYFWIKSRKSWSKKRSNSSHRKSNLD